MKPPVVEIQALSHTYMAGTPQVKTALREVSVTVAEGEVMALIGSTGSGKSTLLQHINGLYAPRSGTVRILGRDLSDPKTDLRRLRREVGLVFQNPEDQIFERYVGDDVAFGPRMAGLAGKELTRRVRWAMELVGLDFPSFRDRPTFALSGGERRKVGLAGVVALRPRILLLDEPTSGLDPEAHEELLDRLEALRDEGMTLVAATHDMDDVARLADRITVLEDGRVVLQGTAREVFSRCDTLREHGLSAPTWVDLMLRLRRAGWDVPPVVLSMEEAEKAILSAAGEAV